MLYYSKFCFTCIVPGIITRCLQWYQARISENHLLITRKKRRGACCVTLRVRPVPVIVQWLMWDTMDIRGLIALVPVAYAYGMFTSSAIWALRRCSRTRDVIRWRNARLNRCGAEPAGEVTSSDLSHGTIYVSIFFFVFLARRSGHYIAKPTAWRWARDMRDTEFKTHKIANVLQLPGCCARGLLAIGKDHSQTLTSAFHEYHLIATSSR